MDRQTLVALKRLLLARDLDSVRQGLELAVSLGDGALVDDLLADVTYDAKRERDFARSRWDRDAPKGKGQLLSARTFAGNGKEQGWFDQALLGLVARGPGAKAQKLRRTITTLAVGGSEHEEPVFDLDFLVGFDALETLLVSNRGGIVNAGRLAALPRLRMVVLSSSWQTAIGDLDGLAAAPMLEELSLSGAVGDLRGLAQSRVKRLSIDDRSVTGLEVVRQMPALEELRLNNVDGPFTGLSGSAIRSLTVDGSWDLTLEGAGTLPNLRVLVCRSLAGLTAAPELEWLDCHDPTGAPCFPKLVRAKVHSLAGIAPAAASFPALEELTVWEVDAPHWSALAKLPKLRKIRGDGVLDVVTTDDAPPFELVDRESGEPLTTLSFRGGLTSLRGIGHLGAVETLDLSGCSELTTLAGVEGLKNLRALDLRGCATLRDASALAGLDLRVIAGFGCPLATEGGLPDEHAWAVTLDKGAKLDRLATRSRPAAPKKIKGKAPVLAVDEALWAEIAAALRPEARDRFASFDRAADLAAQGGLPVYERLLKGARFADRALRGPGLGLPGSSVLKQHALRRLVAEAPPGCAVAAKVRGQITSLALSGGEPRSYRNGPVDLRPLAAFPNLTELTVEDAEPLLHPETLRACRGLTEIHLELGKANPEIAWVSDLPLRRLSGNFASLAGAGALKRLESYEGEGPRADLGELAGCAALETVRWVKAESGDLSGLPALRRVECVEVAELDGWRSERLTWLSASGVRRVGDLRGLAALEVLDVECFATYGPDGYEHAGLVGLGPLPPSLVHLELHDPTVGAVEGLEALVNLRTVELDVWEDGMDIGWLARLPALQELRLGYGITADLRPLHALPLERLRFWGPTHEQIEAILAHPTLKVAEVGPRAAGFLPERLRETEG